MRWLIGTVETEEHYVYCHAGKFHQVKLTQTPPSIWPNIEASNGYKHFVLDRKKDIPFFTKFCIVYVNSYALIISKLISGHFIEDRPSKIHFKMNGHKIIYNKLGAKNDENWQNWCYSVWFGHILFQKLLEIFMTFFIQVSV